MESMKRQRENIPRKSEVDKKPEEAWERRWELGKDLNAKGKTVLSPGLRLVMEETARLDRMPKSFQEFDTKVMDAVGGKREYLVPDHKEKKIKEKN